MQGLNPPMEQLMIRSKQFGSNTVGLIYGQQLKYYLHIPSPHIFLYLHHYLARQYASRCTQTLIRHSKTR